MKRYLIFTELQEASGDLGYVVANSCQGARVKARKILINSEHVVYAADLETLDDLRSMGYRRPLRNAPRMWAIA